MALSLDAAPADPEDISAQLAELNKQVHSLQERVKALEERLEKATIILPKPQPWLGKPTIKVPVPFFHHECIPKGWQKRKFNGITYYVIPLGQNVSLTSYLEK